jgi:hypothetical protein
VRKQNQCAGDLYTGPMSGSIEFEPRGCVSVIELNQPACVRGFEEASSESAIGGQTVAPSKS